MSDFLVLYNNHLINLTWLLREAKATAITLLQYFADDRHFLENLRVAFGSRISLLEAQTLQHQIHTGHFTLPKVEICLAADLNGAYAAYVPNARMIYLAAEFLTGSAQQPELIVAVLLEELGHAWDAQLNSTRYAGNRGKVFSALVRGEILDEVKIIILRVESDAAKIWLTGRWVGLEMVTKIKYP